MKPFENYFYLPFHVRNSEDPNALEARLNGGSKMIEGLQNEVQNLKQEILHLQSGEPDWHIRELALREAIDIANTVVDRHGYPTADVNRVIARLEEAIVRKP